MSGFLGVGGVGAHSVDGEQVLPSLKVLKFHSSNSYDQPGNSECVCERERTLDGRSASRAHTASAARGQDREDRRRGVCVPRRRPCPGADHARAHARTEAGTRTYMLQAACRPARPCVEQGHELCRGPKTRGVTSGVSKVFLLQVQVIAQFRHFGSSLQPRTVGQRVELVYPVWRRKRRKRLLN